MSSFGIAAVQMDLAAADNRVAMAAEVARIAERFPWVRLVVFSELCAFGAGREAAQPLPGAAEDFFRDLARRHRLWLVPGSLFERCGDHVYNTAPVIDPAGEVVLRYRKIYPWYPYEQGVSAGDRLAVFDIPDIGRFGVMICYDMWFPEVARGLAVLGAEAIIHPTYTTTLDRGQELVLARANAIANQCYFIDVNGAGALGRGQSQLVGPEGEVIHLAGERPEVMPVRLDLDRVRQVRRDGTAGTVQVLKSFRDGRMQFPAYAPDATYPALSALGTLSLPMD